MSKVCVVVIAYETVLKNVCVKKWTEKSKRKLNVRYVRSDPYRHHDSFHNIPAFIAKITTTIIWLQKMVIPDQSDDCVILSLCAFGSRTKRVFCCVLIFITFIEDFFSRIFSLFSLTFVFGALFQILIQYVIGDNNNNSVLPLYYLCANWKSAHREPQRDRDRTWMSIENGVRIDWRIKPVGRMQ